MPENEAFDGDNQDPTSAEPQQEDPLHGPSVIRRMKGVPPMPCGNGLYYQPGAFSESGMAYVNALGQPVSTIGRSLSGREAMRLSLEVAEWAEAAEQGDQALLELETKRQLHRLDRTGIASAYKDSDACAGGKRRSDCEPAQELVAEVFEVTFQGVESSGEAWGMYGKVKECRDCGLACGVAAQLQDGIPTGIVRFMNMKPSD